jgi:hypothetical protein
VLPHYLAGRQAQQAIHRGPPHLLLLLFPDTHRHMDLLAACSPRPRVAGVYELGIDSCHPAAMPRRGPGRARGTTAACPSRSHGPREPCVQWPATMQL